VDNLLEFNPVYLALSQDDFIVHVLPLRSRRLSSFSFATLPLQLSPILSFSLIFVLQIVL